MRASFGVSINLYEESERCSMIEVVPPFLALKCILCMEVSLDRCDQADRNCKSKVDPLATSTIEGGCISCAGRPDGER